MLELGFWRRERDGQLAEHLGVGVQGVAGLMPCFVWQRRPVGRHVGHGVGDARSGVSARSSQMRGTTWVPYSSMQVRKSRGRTTRTVAAASLAMNLTLRVGAKSRSRPCEASNQPVPPSS